MTEGLDAPPLILKVKGGGTIAYHSIACKPEQKGAPGILFCGGYRSNMGGIKAVALRDFANKLGCGFTRFDYEGHGASSGVFEEGTIGRWFENALSVFDEVSSGPQIIVGSSMGGWIAMLLARARPERIAALILIAPAPDFPTRLIWPNLSKEAREALLDNGLMTRPSEFADEGYPYTWKMIEESKNHNLLDGEMHPYKGPVHVFIGDDDEVIPVAHAKLAADVFHPDQVSFDVIENGDHRLSTPEDINRLAELLVGFLN